MFVCINTRPLLTGGFVWAAIFSVIKTTSRSWCHCPGYRYYRHGYRYYRHDYMYYRHGYWYYRHGYRYYRHGYRYYRHGYTYYRHGYRYYRHGYRYYRYYRHGYRYYRHGYTYYSVNPCRIKPVWNPPEIQKILFISWWRRLCSVGFSMKLATQTANNRSFLMKAPDPLFLSFLCSRTTYFIEFTKFRRRKCWPKRCGDAF